MANANDITILVQYTQNVLIHKNVIMETRATLYKNNGERLTFANNLAIIPEWLKENDSRTINDEAQRFDVKINQYQISYIIGIYLLSRKLIYS